MGIDLAAFEFLLRSQKELGDFGSTLVLGRQRLLMRNEREKSACADLLAKYRPDLSLEDIEHSFVDRMIEKLGGEPCHFLDNSAYEGAQVIHDLNEPLPEALRASYDTVIDVGVLEHVFNIGVAMKSVAQMVRTGGRFLSLNVADNHLGHGFWQLGPEAYFRTFSPDNGYEPALADLYYRGEFHPVRDPESAGRRLPLKTLGHAYIAFAARKVEDKPVFPDGWPVQADYVAAWILFLSRRAAREGDVAQAEKILHDAAARYPANPIYHVELSRRCRVRRDLDQAEIHGARALEMAGDFELARVELAAVMDAKAARLAATAAEAHKPAAATPATAAEAHKPAAAAAPGGEADEPTIMVGAVEVALDDPRLNERTRDALKRGRYEFKEREIARRLLQPGDRVVELGAGMGVVSLTIAKALGDEAVLSFEANPVILELARENVARNASTMVIRQAIASPRVLAEETPFIEFFALKSFEASSTRQTSPSQKPIMVPAMPLEDVIAEHRANAMVFDIEGFEEEIILNFDFAGIDKVMFEIHPKKLGREKTLELVSNLESKRLFLRHDLVFGDVIAFDRDAERPGSSSVDLFAASLDFEERMNAGEHEAARSIADRIAPAFADNAYFQFRLSQLDRSQGKPGVEAAERAVRLGSRDFLLFASLASIYCNAGRFADAAPLVDGLEEVFPASPAIPQLRARLGARGQGRESTQ